MEHKWHNPVDTELLASVLSSWSSQERGEGETLLQSLVMMILNIERMEYCSKCVRWGGFSCHFCQDWFVVERNRMVHIYRFSKDNSLVLRVGCSCFSWEQLGPHYLSALLQ